MRNIVELKNKNLLDILKVIQISGSISKPDIAVRSQVSNVTVHNIITELEKSGLVISNGTAKSNGGRKATLYSINRECGYIVGLNHSRSRITTSIYDLSLNAVYENRTKADITKSVSAIDNMKSEIQTALLKSGISKDKIFGIGITLPGQINHREGVVNSLLNLQEWENTPLQSIMEKYFGLPVCVYNDNRASIISCKWRGKISDTANAAYINIVGGVGAGVMINGEVFSGSHSFAGELGHLAVPGYKEKCHCGIEGCIESITSSASVIKQVRKKYGESVLKGQTTRACEEEIIQMAKENPDVYAIIKEATQNFIHIIDAVVKAYDPEKIIISNAWLRSFSELYSDLTERVFKQCKWLRKNTLSFELDIPDADGGFGPASVVLEDLFNYHSENRII